MTGAVAHEKSPAVMRATRARAQRQVGYAIAIVVNVIFLCVVNVWPSWRALTFLTPEAATAVWIVNVAAIVAIPLNLMCILIDRRWLKAFTELIGASFSVAFFVELWRTIPFDFPDGVLNWTFLAPYVIVAGIVGSSIAIVVQIVFVIVRLTQDAHKHEGRRRL